ncbi:MAG: HD domain-containing protein, partial [Proteobacteria bacterium]|nr:HD domain-containing protein [Pseudomonadota bacterium]
MVSTYQPFNPNEDIRSGLSHWLQNSGFLDSGYSFPLLNSALELIAEKGTAEFQNLGVKYMHHGLMMAEVVGTLLQEDVSLSAAVLYNLHADGLITGSEVSKRLSVEVKELIEATKQIEEFRAIQQTSGEKTDDLEQLE